MTDHSVTIVMPANNAATTIGKAIQSVRDQRFQDWKLLIIDDGSEDRTAEIVRWFATKDMRIRLLRLPTCQGVAAARNRGLDLSKTRYVAFLDSDDAWVSEKLERQIAFMQQSGTAITFSSYERIDTKGNQLGIVVPPSKLDRSMMLRANFIGNLTAVFDRTRLPELRFKPVANEDYLFWFTALGGLKEPVLATPSTIPLARYRVSVNTPSADEAQSMRSQWKIYRRSFGFGLVKSCACIISYAYYSAKKRPSKAP